MRPPFRALVLLFVILCSRLLAGSLQVNLSPPEIVSAGAQWRVGSGVWQASGATVSHTVGYNLVAGYTSPASEGANLAEGEALSLARSYAVTTGLSAQFIITLQPATKLAPSSRQGPSGPAATG